MHCSYSSCLTCTKKTQTSDRPRCLLIFDRLVEDVSDIFVACSTVLMLSLFLLEVEPYIYRRVGLPVL